MITPVPPGTYYNWRTCSLIVVEASGYTTTATAEDDGEGTWLDVRESLAAPKREDVTPNSETGD